MNKTIMVVDDEDIVRKTIMQVFIFSGYSVIGAKGGPEALELLKTNDVNVFFLDLMMPEMSGVELCRRIKKTRPKSCLFALTGHITEFHITECREAGFDDYFVKPFTIELMRITVRTAFERIARWDEIEKGTPPAQ
jgi:DNA-binding response OmpR family regulator